jgi:hypothetical protein
MSSDASSTSSYSTSATGRFEGIATSSAIIKISPASTKIEG